MRKRDSWLIITDMQFDSPVPATDAIRSQFDYQNLSPKPLLTTEPLIPAQLPAAQLPAIHAILLCRFSLGVITHLTLSRSAHPALCTFALLLLDQLFRHGTTPAARPSLVRDSVSDLARPKGQLILENARLRQQLVILQRQIRRPHLKDCERFFLLVLASRLAHWKQALRIIQPGTLLRWHREGFRLFWRHTSRPTATTPQIARETVDLIQRRAKENLLWGAERIQGELLKLGIRVAKRTIQRYMRPVRPSRPSGQTCSTFLKTHAQDIGACDLLPVTDLFFRPTLVFFVIALASRRVVPFGVTRHPKEAWTAQPLREATPFGVGPTFLIRDNDNKFGALFNRVAKGTGIAVLKIPFRTPRAKATCERFLGSVRRECLDHLRIFSERQLYRVLREYVEYFNRVRPQQGLGQQIPEGPRGAVTERRSGKILAFPVLNVSWPKTASVERSNCHGSS